MVNREKTSPRGRGDELRSFIDLTQQRNAHQVSAIPDPGLPATGTSRIEAKLREARERRDAAVDRALSRTSSRRDEPSDG